MATNQQESREVCLVTGVGPGTGAAIARRFAQGYQVAMLARNGDRLKELEQQISNAKGYVCDVTDTDQLKATLATVKQELGEPSALIHNAVGGAFGSVLEVDAGLLERNFRINTLSLLHLIQDLGPAMVEKGKGVIIATGNTSAYRGKPNFAAFAPTKAAQRILIESTARSLGPEGVHAAYVAIDAVIDLAWTRKAFPGRPDEFYIKPADIADEVWHIAHQAPSAWSSELVIRPPGEVW